MTRSPKTLDSELDEALDRELDEALEMTFPASDPVAIAAPGSTSRASDSLPTPAVSAAQPAKPARIRRERLER